MKTVFVSGFTGYIALHIVKQLLEKKYKVIGSVRSESKGNKYADIINDSNFSYVVVPQISEDGAFDEAFKTHSEITEVYHVASPVVFDPKDPEKDVLFPAIKGTNGILKSIHQYGKNVKRVVVTSSYAAKTTYVQHHVKYQGVVINEESKDDLKYDDAVRIGLKQPQTVYYASKKFAEEAAWEFMKTNKPNFELTTLCPTWCFGPQAYDEVAKEGPVSTLNIIHRILGLKPTDKVPEEPGTTIDVRDIARGHIVAIESKATAGQKLLMATGKFNDQFILNIINDNFKLDLPKSVPVDRDAILCPAVECSKTKKLLDFEWIPVEKSIVDTVEQIVKVKA